MGKRIREEADRAGDATSLEAQLEVWRHEHQTDPHLRQWELGFSSGWRKEEPPEDL